MCQIANKKNALKKRNSLVNFESKASIQSKEFIFMEGSHTNELYATKNASCSIILNSTS